ncbi:hypothetical protein [Bdellovibrio sp. HCB274]|uniref:hypothetical protein n=1 Tax=Bdellovibrio sp. HCB274 TaxID=3394361 RepID=UPI0039B695D3
MKTLAALALIVQFPLVSFASYTQLRCSTIGNEATVTVQVNRAVDAQHPWVGFSTIGANLIVQRNGAHNYYSTAITLSPLSGSGDLNMRGDALQGGVYLQLYPEIEGGTATGRYTGQLFVNDLDKREYFDFRSEGNEPGLVCK